ncbi:response regulator transcription factor [Bradyrhizobium sp. TZ2]
MEAEWLRAITDLLSGRIYVPRWLAEQDDAEAISTVSLELKSLRLTRRRREVLPLLAQGTATKEIARELGIAVGTAKIHTGALVHALGARNRTEAAFFAAKIVQSKVPSDEEGSEAIPKPTKPVLKHLMSAPNPLKDKGIIERTS